MRALKEKNILKGLVVQDDCMSPLVFVFNHEFWPIYFLLGVPSGRLKWSNCVSLQSHVKVAPSVTHLMEVLLFFFLFQHCVSNSIKINFE